MPLERLGVHRGGGHDGAGFGEAIALEKGAAGVGLPCVGHGGTDGHAATQAHPQVPHSKCFPAGVVHQCKKEGVDAGE